jgi:hypothetical protein
MQEQCLAVAWKLLLAQSARQTGDLRAIDIEAGALDRSVVREGEQGRAIGLPLGIAGILKMAKPTEVEERALECLFARLARRQLSVAAAGAGQDGDVAGLVVHFLIDPGAGPLRSSRRSATLTRPA